MAIWQASTPTVIDLEIWEMHYWIESSNYLILEGIEELWRLQVLPGCWLFIVLLVLPVSLWKFSHFRSRLSFSGFHLRVMFLFFFNHFLFFFFFNCPIMHFKIQNSPQIGGWFIKMILAEEKRQQPCWLQKIPQEKTSSV